MKFYKCYFTIFIVLFIANACADPLEVDISNVNLTINEQDIEKPLFESSYDSFRDLALEMAQKDEDLYNFQMYCLQLKSVLDTNYETVFEGMRSFDALQMTHKEIQKINPSKTFFTKKITDGFKRLRIHFPLIEIPKTLYYGYSGFQVNTFASEENVFIGLERYLGPKNKVTKSLPSSTFFEWIKEGMDAKYLHRDVLLNWLETNVLPVEDETPNFLEIAINYGKLHYLIHAAFPDDENAIVMRYDEKDYDWALRNELLFWKYIVDQNHLFTTDSKLFANYFQEGPFTPGIPEKGPDRLGRFLGYRIVCSYMEQKKITPAELLTLNASEIIQEYEINE